MLLHNKYWLGDIKREIEKFISENPSTNQDAIGQLSFIFAPIWSRSTYFVIEGTDNDLEQRLHSLYRQSPSYKIVKAGGITGLQVGAESLAIVKPLLSGLKVAHEGKTAEAALLAALPLVK